MSIDGRLERLTGIVEALANTVVARDNHIEALLIAAEKQAAATANLEKRWWRT